MRVGTIRRGLLRLKMETLRLKTETFQPDDFNTSELDDFATGTEMDDFAAGTGLMPWLNRVEALAADALRRADLPDHLGWYVMTGNCWQEYASKDAARPQLSSRRTLAV